LRNLKTSKLVVVKFIIAAVMYACFAVYLFLPHFRRLGDVKYFFPMNLCLACLGCYVLSRRWMGSFIGSFAAGAVYGFGPYMLGLIRFHPLATFLAASVPWLFCPAAFLLNRKWHWLSVLLSTLPFVAIVLFFRMAKQEHIFLIPTQAKVQLSDLFGLLAPLVISGRSATLLGFYHVPVAPLIIGISMMVAAQRHGIIAIIILSVALAMSAQHLQLFMEVSPVMWLSVAVLCCSVLIGEGVQGLALAGHADRKWILTAIFSMGTLTIVTLLFAAKYFELFAGMGKGAARLFSDTAKLYLLGTLVVSIIFFMLRAKRRLVYLRWLILCSAIAVDIFLSARFIIDRVFLGII